MAPYASEFIPHFSLHSGRIRVRVLTLIQVDLGSVCPKTIVPGVVTVFFNNAGPIQHRGWQEPIPADTGREAGHGKFAQIPNCSFGLSA